MRADCLVYLVPSYQKRSHSSSTPSEVSSMRDIAEQMRVNVEVRPEREDFIYRRGVTVGIRGGRDVMARGVCKIVIAILLFVTAQV